MQPGASAYYNTQTKVMEPRELEASLLMKGSRLLQEAKDQWDWQDWAKLEEALFFNQKLWNILVTSVTSPENPLPRDIRENVANIGIFILGRIYEIMQDPRPESVNAIINLNRQLAAGLRSE